MTRFLAYLTIAWWCLALLSPVANGQDLYAVRQDKGSGVMEVFNPLRGQTGNEIVWNQGGTVRVLHTAGADETIVQLSLSLTDVDVLYFAKRTAKRTTDIFRLNSRTGELKQLTRDNGHNLGPYEVRIHDAKGERYAIVYTTSKNDYLPHDRFGTINQQIALMELDGSNQRVVGHMNMQGALDPTPLHDGFIMWTSGETQGMRDPRQWGIFNSKPNVEQFGPLVSAFKTVVVYHWQTQLADGRVVVGEYYNKNNRGAGTLDVFPYPLVSVDGKPFQSDTNEMRPHGMTSLTPFAHSGDFAAYPDPAHTEPTEENDEKRMGKLLMPRAMAGDKSPLLVVHSYGPVNFVNAGKPRRSYVDKEYVPHWYIAAIDDSTKPVKHPGQMRVVWREEGKDLLWPTPRQTWAAIHGKDIAAARIEQNKVNASQWKDQIAYNAILDKIGITGTASMINRTTAAPEGERFTAADFNSLTAANKKKDWKFQGSDSGKSNDADIRYAVVVYQEPTPNLTGRYRDLPAFKSMNFHSSHDEVWRIGGYVRLGHDGNPIDHQGNRDTSWAALIPAGVSFTFLAADANGHPTTVAQTWHQVQPGEIRTDCGGCHAHDKTQANFGLMAAAKPDYRLADLRATTPLPDGKGGLQTLNQTAFTPEYTKHIEPILDAHCVKCHNATANAGGLDLSDKTLEHLAGESQDPQMKVTRTYRRLADDEAQKLNAKVPGHNRLVNGNLSRYIRHAQPRMSLLAWKLYGARLDGYSNEDTDKDLDYIDGGCEAHKAPAEAKAMVSLWIIAGCQIINPDFAFTTLPPDIDPPNPPDPDPCQAELDKLQAVIEELKAELKKANDDLDAANDRLKQIHELSEVK